VNGLQRRLGRVAAVERARRTAADPVLPFLLVSPGQWPPEEAAASWAAEAAGDQAAMDDLVERHTGERPAPPGAGQLVVLLREVPGGPR
jgi:hypothetical protein